MSWQEEQLERQRVAERAEQAADRHDVSSPETPTIDWLEPQALPDEMLAVQPFDDDLMPASLRGLVADIAERLQCPPDFPAVAAVVVLAGIVGRKIGIRPQQRTPWLVIPNLWGAVIGRPGLMKTPAIQEPLKMLHRLEAEGKAEFDRAMRDHETALVVSKLERQEVERKMKEALRRQEGVDDLVGNLHYLEPIRPVRQRYLVNDCTVEKLGELLNENPNGVTVFRDELVGLLKSLDKEGREGARTFFLEAWNGDGRFTYDRIQRGTLDIPAAIVSIIGGIQPGPLGDYIRKLESGGAGDDGLLQRFQLAVWPDCPKSWRNVDRWPDTAAKQTAFGTYERLNRLDTVKLAAERDDGELVPYLRFSEAAQEGFNGWRGELEPRVRSGGEHPAVESHLAKYRSLVPSLALLFHLADEPDGGPVTESALLRALDWAKYLESHARRIYGSIALASLGAAHRLAAKIRDGAVNDGFTLRDVYRNGWSGLTDRKQVAAAVDVLTDHGWLQVEEIPTDGRPATVYRINPRIRKRAA